MSPLLVVVSIVLVDLLGFTVVMPLLPRFAQHYGFSDARIGWLFAAYPMCQLVAGPILGRLSDRVGRRPVLAFSQAGTAISFVMFALSNGNYTWMLIARMLDGASGGNILVAMAYVADVTKPEDRSRGLGLIGAAFGVGFVLGPLLGGAIVSLPIAEEWRLRLPFLVAAGFSTAAWILVLLKLPESRSRTEARVLSARGLIDLVRRPMVGGLVGVRALSVLAFAALEGTFSLFLLRRLGWGAGRAALGFAYLGFISALVQGGLIRRLVPRFGERRLILVGLATAAVGFALLTQVAAWPGLLVALLIAGVGQGVATPSTDGLLSRSTPADEQGAVFGASSSAQTASRIIGYVAANRLLAAGGPSAPYWGAALVATAALGLAGLVVGTKAKDVAPVDVAETVST